MSVFHATAAESGFPYWWEDAQPLPRFSQSTPAKTELLIIGAGYTGLSAAIAASDAGTDVTVVDADTPGLGASTRNGGMFGAHPRFSYEKLAASFGEKTAAGIYAEAQDAFDFTSGLIASEGIDCCFEQTGRIQLAWTKKHFEAQQTLVAAIKRVADMPLEIVPAQQVREHVASDSYFGGIYFPNHAALQPRQFHDGLVSAVLKRGIRLVTKCSINSIEQVDGKFKAHTEVGNSIVADRVLMATNGYTRGKFNWFTRRVYPLPSYLIATEPLSKETLYQLAPGKRMMVETRAQHSYFRLSHDQSRIIFGGRAAINSIPLDIAAKRLHANMCDVWPELSDTQVTHVWKGNTGYSFEHMPHVGEHNGIFYAMGYSGSGVALAAYLGAKAAWQCLNDDRGQTAYSDTRLKPAWFFTGGRPWFLSLADFWFHRVVDKKERAQANRDRLNKS